MRLLKEVVRAMLKIMLIILDIVWLVALCVLVSFSYNSKNKTQGVMGK